MAGEINILFPPARMIGGNIDELQQKKDSANKPKIGKDGKPEMSCSIGIAIPKNPGEQAFYQTPWGAQIYQAGQATHPAMVANPAFSWKVIDGDSAIPNKNGNKPCEQTGYPGNWILWFSQGWLPKRVNADGSVELQAGSIVPGYYVQVYGSVAGNKPVVGGTPGVYLNPLAVALIGLGERIVTTSVDTTAVGFGAAPLPPGASPVPLASPAFAGQPGMPPMMPGMPPVPGMPPMPPGAAAPPLPPAAPAGPVMLPAAQGQTYAAMIGAGWTDATLVQHGMMQAAAPAMPTPPLPPGPPVGAPPVVPPAAPSQTFLTPGAPPVPPAPAPPAVRAMLPAAQGVTYEAFKAQNWTDEQLRAQGMMQ